MPPLSLLLLTCALAEHLASRGYVVASIPMLGTFSREPGISARGLETMALDLLATVRALAELPFDAGDRVGAVRCSAS